MKAILLVAGEGKRLRPYTDNIPKCKVELDNKSLVEIQLETLSRANVNDITLVSGYKAEHIEKLGYKTINNKDYKTTNMVYTLWCAKEEIVNESSIIISYGDIIYDQEVIEQLIKCPEEIAVVIDKDWKNYWKARIENILDDAETLRMDTEGNIIELGKKPNSLAEIEGQYIGLMKFQGKGIKVLVDKLIHTLGILEENECGEYINNSQYYMTDLIQDIINDGYNVKSVVINGEWLEIDTVNDYESLKKIGFNLNNSIKENRDQLIKGKGRF